GIDRLFYRDRPNYRRTVSEVSAALTSLLDLDEILARIGHTLSEGFQLTSLDVLLWLDDGIRRWRYHSRGEAAGWVEEAGEVRLGAISGLLEQAPRRPVSLVDGDARRPASAAARGEMQHLGAVLLVPLAVGARALGA